jgi:hypothetical protein
VTKVSFAKDITLPVAGEASYYGPNVGEYFTRGKLLDLSQTTKNSNFEKLDKDYLKFWTKEFRQNRHDLTNLSKRRFRKQLTR